MAEKDFQSEFTRGLQAAGAHAYKIPDIPVGQLRAAGIMRFVEAKPYDCYFAAPGVPWCACELKQAKKQSVSTGRDTADLKPHQEASLLDVVRVGQVGLLVVHFFFEAGPQVAKKLGLAPGQVVDRAFAARIEDVVRARQEAGLDSLPVTWWEIHATELELYREKGQRCWRPHLVFDWLSIGTQMSKLGRELAGGLRG